MPELAPEVTQICDLISTGQRFLLSSHARPDGDSLGSQLALGAALDQLGKGVRIVNAGQAPDLYGFLPDVSRIEVSTSLAPTKVDALIVLECSTLVRTGVEGLARYRLVNIDHHAGNAMFGAINWHDASACACAELVFELIDALGVRLTPAMATQLYVAILTATGSFRHANITERTFEICRRIAATGVEPAAIAAQVYNNGSLGRLRLTGMLLDRMELADDHRIAVLTLTGEMLNASGCAPDDLEGIVNMPLAVRNVQAVVFLKHTGDGLRVSLRSKDDIDVRAVAVEYGGGGHRNAAGLTLTDAAAEARAALLGRVAAAIAEADGPSTSN